jgi:2-keto-4-pentenoate hydratase/2-oxohepta-3-ene-1,7-dioic acid hydratase in catechol pathway
MKFGRIETPDGRQLEARFEDGAATAAGGSWALEELRILPPVVPSKLIYVGMNYTEHAEELGADLPAEPLLFFKPPSAMIGPGDPIVYPRGSQRLDYEGELVVVIGEACRDVEEARALDVVAGYTIGNDVTARDWQRPDTQWTKAKAWDTFAPLGPWVHTDLDASDVVVRTLLNGEVRQESSTAKLHFGIPELIAFASRLMTLLPGDIIATGTPVGIGAMQPGDVVEVQVEGIGSLRNPVIAAPAAQ